VLRVERTQYYKQASRILTFRAIIQSRRYTVFTVCVWSLPVNTRFNYTIMYLVGVDRKYNMQYLVGCSWVLVGMWYKDSLCHADTRQCITIIYIYSFTRDLHVLGNSYVILSTIKYLAISSYWLERQLLQKLFMAERIRRQAQEERCRYTQRYMEGGRKGGREERVMSVPRR